MKNKFSINIELTWSKLMSLLILIAGTSMSAMMMYRIPDKSLVAGYVVTIMTLTLTIVATTLGIKQISDIWKKPVNGKE